MRRHRVTSSATEIAGKKNAIQERLDGKTADWMEKVSGEQYPDPKLFLEVRAVTKNTCTSFNSGKDRENVEGQSTVCRMKLPRPPSWFSVLGSLCRQPLRLILTVALSLRTPSPMQRRFRRLAPLSVPGRRIVNEW